MSTIINLAQANRLPKEMLRSQAYNALDGIGTLQIAKALQPLMTTRATETYRFEMAAQLPAFAMTTRGILIDQEARAEVTRTLRKEQRLADKNISALPEVMGIWDGTEKVTGECPNSTRKDGKHTWEKGIPDGPTRKCMACGTSRFVPAFFNPSSHPQVAHLLYDLHGLPRQYGKPINGKKAVTTDDRALDRLGRKYKRIKPLTDGIAEFRGIAKQLGFLKSRLTKSGRFASVFNVGAAWTGRWSSNKNPYGEGGNSQNLAERHRFIFQADPGFELCYMDLKQAESNTVAHLAGDEKYIEAHVRGDVHTYVTRLVWPEYDWNGDDKHDAKIAKSILPEWDNVPGHDIRFQSKRLQHGSNYGLTPPGIAAIAHIPQAAARAMQTAYFRAFPQIQPWQRSIAVAVANQEALVNPLGVEVKLFGRPWDEHTYKQGLSFKPQSTVGHIVAISAWRIYLEQDPYELQLLAQIHDALLFQFPTGRLEVVEKAFNLMRIPIEVEDIHGTTRLMLIEPEASTGANWGHANDDPTRGRLNPLGLREVHF